MERGLKMIVSVVVISLVLAGTGFAADQLIESVKKGCEKELTSFCSQVTPGEGRGLACLYAHNDKLSAKCEYALYDAAAQLERLLAALTYVANECRDDLKSFCADVKPGEGRLLDCVEKNKDKLSSRCKTAINDVGLKKSK